MHVNRLALVMVLIAVFLLSRLPASVGITASLLAILTIGYIAVSMFLGLWRLFVYGGRNQRDKAKKM